MSITDRFEIQLKHNLLHQNRISQFQWARSSMKQDFLIWTKQLSFYISQSQLRVVILTQSLILIEGPKQMNRGVGVGVGVDGSLECFLPSK